MFSDLNLTDMETCYKVFRREIIQSIKIHENRFGFEPEVAIKVSRIPDIRIYEVGISYSGRTYKEGKKIGWKDGVRAIYCILKYGMFRRDKWVARDATIETDSKRVAGRCRDNDSVNNIAKETNHHGGENGCYLCDCHWV